MLPKTILAEVETLETIREVLAWASNRSPRAHVIDALAQDEFTHDITVQVAPEFFVSFDVARTGLVRSASCWDHAPSADELLSRRITDGWSPTFTPTKHGDVVLGYAACLEPVG